MDNKNYASDKAFIGEYHQILELAKGNCKVLVSPTLQGRVVTSTTGGDEGYSFGWINYALIESREILPHCNNFGGEDRFWVGPEGGQFSIFFPKGTDFAFEDWQAPAAIDNEAWDCVSHSDDALVLGVDTVFTNTSGNDMKCRLERTITLLDDVQVADCLGVETPDGLECVAFQSENRMTNKGDFAWDQSTGMLSIWTLGQFIPSDDNYIIIPFKEAEGEAINDSYFGRIPDDRFSDEGGIIRFKGDGNMRGKIGIPPGMVIPVAVALDRVNSTLTVVKFTFDDPTAAYVNSMWEHQEFPFKGDVINSYNDGPLDDGTVMGGFYEIETSSPAAALSPSETLVHRSTTVHFKGDIKLLEAFAAKLCLVESL